MKPAAFDYRAPRSLGDAVDLLRRPSPSAYLRRMWYDTIVHDAQAVLYLAERVKADRIVVGSDDSFPPADRDPLAGLRAAGFDANMVRQISEDNPRQLFCI